MDTRSTDEIVVTNSDIIDELVSEEVSAWLKEIVDKLSKELEDLWSVEEWIKIENKPFYYLPKRKLLIVDCTRRYCKRVGIASEVDGFRVRPLQTEEVRDIFVVRKTPLVDENFFFINHNDYYSRTAWLACVENNNNQICIRITDAERREWIFNDGDSIKIPVYDFESQISLIENFLKNDLIPEKIPKGHELYKLLKEKALIYDGGIKLSSRLEEEFNRGELDNLLGHQFSKETVLNKLKDNKLSAEKQDSIIEKLLNCDNLRAKIEPYDIKRLEDPNLGHWDLWSSEGVKAKLDRALVGRNPLADVKEDGIIGIDFGTKSTIVVYQDGDDNTQPMRVGRGDFSKELKADDFENPTVMEFINLDDFLNAYNRKEGRPDTRWEDLTISHTAFNSLLSVNTKSDEYYSFFNDLKQWSGDKTRQIRLRDKNGHEYVLPAFVDIEEDAFNPIEIYAYYLGLFINNMYKGIYLNYILSFPVTYEKEVREKIIQSFERGIKKSLPLEILHDEECMQKFRIMQGASEPAAYAICALQQYGFDPEPGEKVFYGIFDFGGGTTDFDFGIWRSADETERRYDYVINHFGAGGDKYLGGENLLELLAFEVFKENQNRLIENKIAFYKPTECRAFAGSEVLI
ncbi:MAG: hypothetical protein ACI3ZR_08990, partial [bacterium]